MFVCNNSVFRHFTEEHTPRNASTGSESQTAAPLAGNSVQAFFSGSKASTTLGGKASEQPPRTPVSKEEIEAILLGGCI
ncbi:hypothetical protein ACLB2K_048941 [Fragaria x ananassa]